MQHNSQQGYPLSPSTNNNNTPGMPPPSSERPARPTPSQAYTSGSVPTMAPGTPYSTYNSARPSTTSSHSYSRSSPGARYVPFSPGNPPETPQYTQQRYYPTDPNAAVSQSPLALADIRQGYSLESELLSPNPYRDAAGIVQSPSSYLAPWPIYASDWCNWPLPRDSGAGKMAICSYLEDPHNFIQILDTSIEPQEMAPPGSSQYGVEFTRIAEATCSYPITRILWEPPSQQKQMTDLLATSGDHLRLWSLPSSTQNTSSNTISRSSSVNRKQAPAAKLTPLALLSNSKTPEHTAPLTSLDWNQLSPKLIITSSIDTTCTIWDIPTLTAKTQLIAHDKEVYDVKFCAGSVDTFVSCGADGSVRMFDLRSLDHSTIIYEPSEKSPGPEASPALNAPGNEQHMPTASPPLLRLAASPHDSHLLATFAQDSKIIRILDHRQPGQALLELHGHSAALSCIEWSPTRRGLLASGADDSLVLQWDLMNPQNSAQLDMNGGSGGGSSQVEGTMSTSSMKGPASSWRSDFEVTNLSWSPRSQLTEQTGDWLAVTGGRAVYGVKM